jgi:septal ring factor EnvC (AmiA/AmiB activator)
MTPSPLREAAGYAQAHLYDVLKHTEAMDTAAERRAGMQALCEQSEAALTRATAELKATQSELAQVQRELTAKQRVLEDGRARSTAEINAQIERAQAEHAGFMARIEKTRQAIIDTDRSMESLVRRLRVG